MLFQFPPFVDISIHALHEESDRRPELRVRRQQQISIHALHEESDIHDYLSHQSSRISIHALHEESDRRVRRGNRGGGIFQSTLSMRRATVQLDIFVRFLRRKPAA